MADLIGAMERLWFHQTILVLEPTSLQLLTKNPLTKQPLAHHCMDSPSSSSSGISLDTPSTSLLYKDDSDIERVDEQQTRLNLTARRARSHPSLPSTQAHKRSKRNLTRHPDRAVRLEKSMSCRSFQELELEELKGFMDLGFKFNTEQLNPRLLRVVPGLQRLGLGLSPSKTQEIETLFEEEEEEEEEEDDDEDDDGERAGVMRPYLSEAWLIRRPDSPLLNLRVPRVTAASDMKKHLICWARTVAYVIQQESS